MGDDFDVVGSVTINDDGTATLQLVNANLDQMQQKSGQVGNAFSALGSIGNFIWGQLIVKGIEMATQAVSQFLSGVITAGEAGQNALAQLNAVITSTGGAAGMTADAVEQLAQKYALLTGYTKTSIVAGETSLLQFQKIGSDIFPQATQAALDLARRTGQDLGSAFTTVGKALGDPVMGIGRLNQAYKLFEPAQLKAIEQMAKLGHVAEAQQIILDALNAKVGGAAAAYGDTFAGKMDIAKASLDLVEESIFNLVSNSPLVSGFFAIFDDAVTKLNTFLTAVNMGADISLSWSMRFKAQF